MSLNIKLFSSQQPWKASLGAADPDLEPSISCLPVICANLKASEEVYWTSPGRSVVLVFILFGRGVVGT